MQVATRDLDEAVAAVGQVYCPHELRLHGRERAVNAKLRVIGDHTPHVSLAYGARVEVDAGSFAGLILVMHAVSGVGHVRQPSGGVMWHGGQTVVVPANRDTQFSFDPMFLQSTLRLDPVDVRAHCESLAGTVLDQDVEFRLGRIPPALGAVWSQVLALSAHRAHLSGSAVTYLRDVAIDLLVRNSPHNYSALFSQAPLPVPRAAADAVAVIDSLKDYEAITVADLAQRVGVGARTLERAFQEAFGMSPARYLRDRRLDRARRQLENASPGVSVTDVAMTHGFFHLGRFARYYRERFGELPAATLARHTGCPTDFGQS